VPSCGDGVLDVLDACDDGNNDAGDGCSPSCAVEHGWDCPPGASACASTCGDGLLAAGAEACDDDNTEAGDGCAADCTVEDGFACVDDTKVPESLCTAECGDRVVLGEEGCDDGNAEAGDGCSATCQLEPQTLVISGPADPSGSATAEFTFRDTMAVATNFECAQDGGAWVDCSDRAPDPGVYRYTWVGTLASGTTYTLAVRGVAPDGTTDPSPATWVWHFENDPDIDGLEAGDDNCPDALNPDQADHDGDAVGDACDADIDGDGIPNEVEDLDGDGRLDSRETDARDADTDGDGLCDGWSDVALFDPGELAPCSAGEDIDRNGVTDDEETDPTVADTDGDCVDDGEEVLEYGTDPLDADDPGARAVCSADEGGGACGCATGVGSASWLVVLLPLLVRRRRAA